jgi:hypothetical protein
MRRYFREKAAAVYNGRPSAYAEPPVYMQTFHIVHRVIHSLKVYKPMNCLNMESYPQIGKSGGVDFSRLFPTGVDKKKQTFSLCECAVQRNRQSAVYFLRYKRDYSGP